MQFSKSSDPEKRLLAAQLIAKNPDNVYIHLVKQLLRDPNDQVKIQIIRVIPKFKDPELCGLLIDYLNLPSVYKYAFDALTECGDVVLDELEQSYYKSEKGVEDQMRIIGVLETIGTKKAVDYLKNKLDVHNIDIFRKVLRALRKNNYQVEPDNFYEIQQLIEKHIGITGWNLAVKASLEDNPVSNELKQAIDEELEENYETIYLLLLIAYKPESVSHFKDNLESDTSEGISYALELLDLFLADELKPKLFPLFDDISLNDRVKQLQLHYPIQKLDKSELLIAILNRDMNAISVWSKACALLSYNNLENPEITDDIIAQLFNPIPILSETAAWVIYNIDTEVFSNCISRLESTLRHQLERKLTVVRENPDMLLVNKALSLKELSVFNTLPGYYVTKFIDSLSVMNKEHTEEFFNQKENLKNSLLFIKEGSLAFSENNTPLVEFQAGEIIDLDEFNAREQISVHVKGQEFYLFHLPKSDFYYEMFDYPKIIENYMKIFDNLSKTQFLNKNEKEKV